jgi:general secretion pathway protein G
MKRNKNTERAFTLIELLIVIIILGILAALTVPRLAGRTEEARRQAAQSDIEGGLSVALDLYEMDTGHYPESLEDLIHKPVNADRWKGPYLKKKRVPLDPWRHPYNYHFPGTYNQPDYDLLSNGPDGLENTEDDIANWEN